MIPLSDLHRLCQNALRKPHGHVKPAPVTARCGGPAMCRHCLLEFIAPMVARAADDGGTHAEGCWGWGPKHYECAVGEIERLQRRVDVLEQSELA